MEWRGAKSVKIWQVANGEQVPLHKRVAVLSLQSGWQSCRCKAGGSFVVAKRVAVLSLQS